MPELLEVRDARVEFDYHGSVIRALDGVSLNVARGESVAVVGESGCGKTTLARAILGLQPLQGGSILLEGTPVRGPSPKLASRVGMVWQDPYASLDPRWTVGRLLEEPARLTGLAFDLEAAMQDVGLDPALRSRYPHQLSGGQRQRVAIGRALALRPPLVICDEPTAALDLSIQAQILNLLKDLQDSLGCAYLYISHDLTTVRYLAHQVAVMYLGRIVEAGATEDVFGRPKHPYTKALLDSAPTVETVGRLPEEPLGEMPDPTSLQVGCRYASRCPWSQDRCTQHEPSLTDSAHRAACWFPLESPPTPKASPAVP